MSRVPKAKTSGMQDKGKGIMQPAAPWKAMPSLGAMPMAGPGQGRTFSASQAFKGLDIRHDPQIESDPIPAEGGFIDPGMISRKTKQFDVRAPGGTIPPEGNGGGDARGGFPANADIGSGYGGIINTGGTPKFKAGFSAAEARSTAQAGAKKPGAK